MANSVYEQLHKPTLTERFQAFMQNPFQSLVESRLNIPQEYQGNPHDAAQYLLNSGQINQAQYNQVIHTAQQLGVKL